MHKASLRAAITMPAGVSRNAAAALRRLLTRRGMVARRQRVGFLNALKLQAEKNPKPDNISVKIFPRTVKLLHSPQICVILNKK
ncbi:hypothetical protein D3Z39_15570 [Anaerotruncus colihominis]|uniref:Uncharacterized protein n=1 Tax=Anaerotruncus colihominis TaxID=169435 RepID=A0A845RN57_9FIRM|nr:hypothetical protein [Anaerotruncus colihominis]